MKKKVLIVGFSINHIIMYDMIFKILSDFDIYFITNNDLLKDYLKNKCKLYCVGWSECLKRNNKMDYIIIDEPYGRESLLYSLCVSMIMGEKILIVHNSNKWFNPHYSLHVGNKSLSIYLNEVIRNAIKNKMSCYAVVNTEVKAYCESFTKKKVVYLPFCYDIACDYNTNNDKLIIVVPGSVSMVRNYDIIMDIIKDDLLFSDNIMFVFLGTAKDQYGKKIIGDAKKYEKNVVVFDQYLSQCEFDNWIKKSDLLMVNVSDTVFTEEGYCERYGISKETGVVSLAIKYAKPLIVSDVYKIPKEVSGQCVFYKSKADLEEILKGIANERHRVKDLSKEALKNNKRISLSEIKKNLLS